MPRLRRFPLPVLACLAILVAACGEDETPVGPAPTPPGAESPAALVLAWQTAYEQFDVVALGDLLDTDYATPLSPAALVQFAWLPEEFDRADELRAADRMFSGIPLANPGGGTVPPASGLSFLLMNQQGAWTEVPAGQPYAGTLAAFFDMAVVVVRDGYAAISTEGIVKFHVAAHDAADGGAERKFYTLAGLIDLTGPLAGKRGETTTWSTIRGLWWTP